MDTSRSFGLRRVSAFKQGAVRSRVRTRPMLAPWFVRLGNLPARLRFLEGMFLVLAAIRNAVWSRFGFSSYLPNYRFFGRLADLSATYVTLHTGWSMVCAILHRSSAAWKSAPCGPLKPCFARCSRARWLAVECSYLRRKSSLPIFRNSRGLRGTRAISMPSSCRHAFIACRRRVRVDLRTQDIRPRPAKRQPSTARPRAISPVEG